MKSLLLLALVAIAAALDTAWYPCPIYTDYYDSSTVRAAQCGIFSLPYSPDAPDQKLQVFIKRLVSPTSTKALWILQGGPGAASDDLDDLVESFFKKLGGDADIYLYEHRGTGRSSRLECVASQPETKGSEDGAQMTAKKYPDCIPELKQVYGDKLKYFSTTEAARDVLTLIKAFNADKKVFVYGISYGTYLANRLKQLDEETGEPVIQGVVLDGVVSSSGKRLTFNDYDVRFNETGLALLDLCFRDPKLGAKCSVYFDKLGIHTPEGLLRQVYDNLFNKNKCPIATKYVTEAGLKKKLGSMLMYWSPRQLLPALLYRLLRCDDELDTGVLEFFFEGTMPNTKPPKCKSLDSDVLRLNVMYGELINATTFTSYYIEHMFNNSLIARGQMLVTAAPVYQLFHQADIVYTPSPKYFNKAFSTSTTSVLLMNGDLDPQTPAYFAEIQYNAIQSPNKKLVIIPYAPHGTIASSPVFDSSVPCAVQMLVSFVKDPQNVDTSCIGKVIPPNFDGYKDLNMEYFGVKNIWEDVYKPQLNQNEAHRGGDDSCEDNRYRWGGYGSISQLRCYQQKSYSM